MIQRGRSRRRRRARAGARGAGQTASANPPTARCMATSCLDERAIAWRIRGETQAMDTKLQFGAGMTAVCKPVGSYEVLHHCPRTAHRSRMLCVSTDVPRARPSSLQVRIHPSGCRDWRSYHEAPGWATGRGGRELVNRTTALRLQPGRGKAVPLQRQASRARAPAVQATACAADPGPGMPEPPSSACKFRFLAARCGIPAGRRRRESGK